MRQVAYPWAVDLFAEAFDGPKREWHDDDLVVDGHSFRLDRLVVGFTQMRLAADELEGSHITRPPNLARDNLITRLAQIYTDETGRKASAGKDDQPFVRFVRFVFLAMFDENPNAPLTAKIIKGALQRASLAG